MGNDDSLPPAYLSADMVGEVGAKYRGRYVSWDSRVFTAPDGTERRKFILELENEYGTHDQFVLNRTNLTYLRTHGIRKWSDLEGKTIVLTVQSVLFAGRTVKGLRITAIED